jgi:hypothetical protein
LELLDRMNPTIEELTAAAEQEARKRPEVVRLMTHPGVGPLTALAYVLIIGTPERFHRGKQVGTYVGMIPSEDSSAGKQRLGHISKQGNSLLRFLLVEAAQAATRINPDWRRRYIHLAMRRHKVGPKPIERLRASRGRRSRGQKKHEDHSSECTESCAQKRFDRADIVRDARYARWIQSVDTTLVRHQPPEDYVLTEEGSDFIMQSALYNSIIAFGGSG